MDNRPGIAAPVQDDWEKIWAPSDEATYQSVLAHIQAEDVIVDIGAGDLRLSIRMAKIARRVYAIEIQEALLRRGLEGQTCSLPGNLVAIQGDASSWQIPNGTTVGVLLMRHCNHFRLYAEKLKVADCRRLITNARWRMGVEVVQLQATRIDYGQVEIGWYACWCGSSGFIPGPVEYLTPEVYSTVHEVIRCPSCAP